jgi:glutamate 5-kinase
MTRSPDAYRRIVVKIGSSLLVERQTGALRRAWLEALAEDVAAVAKGGRDVLIVSSGAIALGRGVLGLPASALKLEESQAAAAVGQIALARAYAEVLARWGSTPARCCSPLATPRSAGAISTPARPWRRCSSCAPCR